MLRSVAVILMMAVVATGCSEPPPTAPTPPAGPMSGVWMGTASGPGTSLSVRLDLQDALLGAAYAITGRYEARAGSTTTVGTAGGVLLQGNVTLTLTPTVPSPCSVTQPFPPDQLLLQLTLDGARMSGEGAITLCGGSGPVQATFTRQ